VVTLTAVPSEGYLFERWSGDVDESVADNTTISVLMDGARTITVNFTAPDGLQTVTIEASPSQGGSVTIQTPCGSFTTDNVQPTISIQFAAGTQVTVTATSAEGYGFRRWKGNLSGREDDVTVNIDSDKAIVASFAKPSPFPWVWVVAGAAAFLAVVLVSMSFVFSRRRKAEGIHPGGEPPS
jgi:hypothetical protein